jgi:hypothetical protein
MLGKPEKRPAPGTDPFTAKSFAKMPGVVNAGGETPQFMFDFAAAAAEKNDQAAFAALLKRINEANVRPEAIARVKAAGVGILKKETMPKSIKAIAGGLEQSQALDEAHGLAKAAIELPDKAISNSLRAELQRRGIKAVNVRKLTPQVLRKAFVSMSRKVAPEAAAAAGGAAAQAGAGAVTGEVAKAAAKAVGKGAKGFIKGGIAGAVIQAALPFGSDSPISMIGQKSRAYDKAVTGFAAMGATSSSAVLNAIVRQQELASHRQLVLQRFEPEMFEKMLDALASNDTNPAAITESERTIGGMQQTAMPARRQDKDVKFLLDQLMNEMSGQL